MYTDSVFTDTIAAVSTPKGLGGIAIVRVSGPKALTLISPMLFFRGKKNLKSLRSWSAALADVVDPCSGEVLDEAVVLVMYGPNSYTREDIVEIQCHGGGIAGEKILGAALKLGARHAFPGEFTMRAYLSGRVSLDEAEAVMDLIGARSESAFSHASKRLKGALGDKVMEFERRLKEITSKIEVAIDYPEDFGCEGEDVQNALSELKCDIDDLLKKAPLGLALASGIEVCLVGRPNVGKSSIFNRLVEEERAIVTDIPGTTRDLLREKTEWHGLPVILIDTAGFRSTAQVVEAIGVKRAEDAALSSEVVVYVLDDSQGVTEEDATWLKRLKDTRLLVLVNKTDLGESRIDMDSVRKIAPFYVRCSTKTGVGLDDLKDKVASFFKGAEEGSVVPGSARQVNCLRSAHDAIARALHEISEGWPSDIVSSTLVEAAVALADVTGKNVKEEILKEIFSKFCVGK